jgi:hypothetical protein
MHCHWRIRIELFYLGISERDLGTDQEWPLSETWMLKSVLNLFKGDEATYLLASNNLTHMHAFNFIVHAIDCYRSKYILDSEAIM